MDLAGLFEYVCVLSQNRSNIMHMFSFENIQNPYLAIAWFNDGIQMTMPLGSFHQA